jgi:lipopolysaccharide biosynthesis glycosyltransferase
MSVTPNSPLVEVLYQSSDSYTFLIGTSMYSLLKNNINSRIIIHLISDDIAQSNLDKFFNMVDKFDNAKFYIHDGAEYRANIVRIGVPPYHGSYTSYLKLIGLDKIQFESKMILYLDGDTLVDGEIDELFFNELYVGYINLPRAFVTPKDIERYGFDYKTYGNAGVMLFDVDCYRKYGGFRKISSMFSQPKYNSVTDQGAINLQFHDQIRYLDQRYLQFYWMYAFDSYKLLRAWKYPKEFAREWDNEIESSKKSPKIYDCSAGSSLGSPFYCLEHNLHPFAKKWHYYFCETPFSSVPLKPIKRNFEYHLSKLLSKSILTEMICVRTRLGQ